MLSDVCRKDAPFKRERKIHTNLYKDDGLTHSNQKTKKESITKSIRHLHINMACFSSLTTGYEFFRDQTPVVSSLSPDFVLLVEFVLPQVIDLGRHRSQEKMKVKFSLFS